MTHVSLDGIRVLDVTTSIAGHFCAQTFAALGADVADIVASPQTAALAAEGVIRA